MVIPSLIEAIAPDISSTALQLAVDFAVNAMRETRDAYHEPVSLLDVALTGNRTLSFTIRALYTHNTSTFELSLPEGALVKTD